MIDGGFQSTFEADDDLLDNRLDAVKLKLAPGGINESLIEGELEHASVQVNTIELSQPNLAADGVGQNVFEVQLNLLTSGGGRVDLSMGNKILRELEITLPFDPQEVLPGDLESGKVKIWFSENSVKFNSLEIESIPRGDVQEIDYINNQISFTVDHLTTFGIGSFEPTPPTPTEGNTPVSSCFIATAAFGDVNDFRVKVLTRFRDDFLLQTDFGRSFINYYYMYSPALAVKITQSPLLATMISWILYPIVILIMALSLNMFGWLLLSIVLLLSLLIIKKALKMILKRIFHT